MMAAGVARPKRARTGDHQHRHRVDQRCFNADAGPPPANQRHQSDHQHHRHEHGRHLIDQPLDRRLGGLCILDQPDDLRQHRFLPDGADRHHDPAFAIDAAAGEPGALVLGDRQRLAREHRFVHLRFALRDHAIGRNPFARPHHQAVAGQHLGHRHVGFRAGAAQHVRDLRPQRMQRANRSGGLPLGARLQPFAQQHERHHDGGRLEVQVFACPMLSQSQIDKPQPALVPIATSRSMLPLSAFSACQPAL